MKLFENCTIKCGKTKESKNSDKKSKEFLQKMKKLAELEAKKDIEAAKNAEGLIKFR